MEDAHQEDTFGPLVAQAEDSFSPPTPPDDPTVLSPLTPAVVSDTHESLLVKDLQVIKNVLEKTNEAWNGPMTIDSTCKLALTQCKVIELRRKLMRLDGPGTGKNFWGDA